MKKLVKYMSIVLIAMMCCLPMVVSAEPEEDAPVVSVDSFVINSNANEKINATMLAVADTEISYTYTVSVVTDISKDGKQVASGSGKTGQNEDINIDMSDINTYSEYRFKIVLNYTVNGEEQFATAFSKTFAYTQESYAEELKGRDITVNVTSKNITIDWSRYMRYGADAVLVNIEVDGEKKVEELIYSEDKKTYEYDFEEGAKNVEIILRQAIDGKLSEGLRDKISLEKKQDKNDFCLVFPEEKEQFNRTWNIQFVNAKDTKLIWKTDNNKKELTLNDAGTFMVEMEENNESLYVEYSDDNKIKWVYDFATDVAAYTPDINMLEAYHGSTVKSESITMVGKISDKTATITVNGNKVEMDKSGVFESKVSLDVGKNTVIIEASNQVGKTARKTITIYRETSQIGENVSSVFDDYKPLIITLGVSLVFIAVLVVTSKRREKKNEEQA